MIQADDQEEQRQAPADESTSLSGDETKAILEFCAPYVRQAILADAKELQAARETLRDYLSPLGRVLDAALKNIESQSALRSPRTALRKQKRRMGRIFRLLSCEPANPEALLRAAFTVFIQEIFPRIPQQMIDVYRSTTVDADKHVSSQMESVREALRRLIDAAVAANTANTRKILSDVEISAFDKGLMFLMPLFSDIEEAADKEQRAQAVLRAAKRVSETLYRPYAKVIYLLWGVTRGRSYGEADYGSTVNNLVADATFKSAYPSLIEGDAVFIRNSEAHEDWEYLYERDLLELHDRGKPARLFSVDELAAKCLTMLEVAGILFPKVLREKQVAPVADWFAGVAPIWPDLLSVNSATRRAATDLFIEYLQSSGQALAEGDTNAPTRHK